MISTRQLSTFDNLLPKFEILPNFARTKLEKVVTSFKFYDQLINGLHCVWEKLAIQFARLAGYLFWQLAICGGLLGINLAMSGGIRSEYKPNNNRMES